MRGGSTKLAKVALASAIVLAGHTALALGDPPEVVACEDTDLGKDCDYDDAGGHVSGTCQQRMGGDSMPTKKCVEDPPAVWSCDGKMGCDGCWYYDRYGLKDGNCFYVNDDLTCVLDLPEEVIACQSTPAGNSCWVGIDEGTCEFVTSSNSVCDINTCVIDSGMSGDPHMVGMQGQKFDWSGEDGGWYVLLSDADLEVAVRLTAPLPEEFPDRQLMTGFSTKYGDGHSIVIENKHPYTTETEDCPDALEGPCLSEHALKITVDGQEVLDVATDRMSLPGGATMTAVNLPVQCQPYGGDVIWAKSFKEIATNRHLSVIYDTVDEWVARWSAKAAAPTWCDRFLAESGAGGLLRHEGKHSVFKIDTPSLTVRLNHGTNHQGGEVIHDGRVLPLLEFWQMDVLVEWYDVNPETVTGMLGETMRPTLDAEGRPIMSGLAALRGEVEDYRVSGPLESDFTGPHTEG